MHQKIDLSDETGKELRLKTTERFNEKRVPYPEAPKKNGAFTCALYLSG
jgi:hypothetical protein